MNQSISLVSKYLFASFFLCFSIIVQAEKAESNIGFVDMNRVFSGSREAQKKIAEFNRSVEQEVEAIKTIETELSNMQTKINEEADTLSPKQQEEVALQYREKLINYNQKMQALQATQQEHDRNLIQILGPTIEEALKEIIKETTYTTILHRNAVAYTDAKHDLTNRLITKLNAKTDQAPSKEKKS